MPVSYTHLGEYPDIIIGCFGGGSNFSGISFPFLRHTLLEGRKTRFIAAEPSSCPKLTRGIFQYDFGDEAGYTPVSYTHLKDIHQVVFQNDNKKYYCNNH